MEFNKPYHIRLASFNDIQTMLIWAKNEGWNPGLQDAFAFQIIDPHGFFMGYINDEPVACISTVKYSQDYAFLGLYIVNPNHRGQGFGTKIWQHAMHYVKTCSTIGLDGVVAQQGLYNKLGFLSAHRNIRYSLTNNEFKHFTHPYLISAEKIPLAEILTYDKSCFLYPRNAFLTTWLLMSNAKSLVYYYNKQIKGYGVIRECQSGYKIGPLFAENDEVASIIFQGLCNTVSKPDQIIFLDIPEENIYAKKFLEEFSLSPIFEVARMYYGKAPNFPYQHIFALTTYEIG